MAMRVRYTVVNGEVIAEKRSGVRKLYVPDPLGSTVALLDSTQTQTDTFSYWPYGEERSRTGTTATPFRFVGGAGYYRDSASRVYVRARDMDRRWGRWSTPELALPFWRALVARLPAPRGESYGLVLAKAAAAGYQYCNVNPLG